MGSYDEKEKRALTVYAFIFLFLGLGVAVDGSILLNRAGIGRDTAYWQTLLAVGLAMLAIGMGLALIWGQRRFLFHRVEESVSEALRRSETNFADMFQTIPDGIAYTALDGTVLAINNSLEQILGLPREQVVGKSILVLANDLLSARNVKHVVPVLLGLIQGKNMPPLEIEYRDKIIEVSATINKASGRLTGVVRDITERKRSEEALRESEEKMRSIFRVAPIGMGAIRDLKLYEVNPRVCEITGYSVEELIGQNAQMLHTAPEEFERVASEQLDQIARQGEAVVETCWRKKDGSVIDVLLSSTLIDTADHSKGAIFTVLDVTERKRAEEALKESEAIFSSFLEHSPVYVFFKDRNIRSLMLSKNFEQMLGMPITSLLGKTMDELFPSDLAKSMIADDQRILNEGKRVTVVEELNGQVYETTKFPVFKDGEPYILAGFTLDITERKQAEEELRRQNQYLLALQETALELVSQLDLEILLENIVKRAAQLIGTDSGYLDLVDEKTDLLLPHIGFGVLAESLDHPAQRGEGVAGTVWQTGEPVIVNDYDNWPGRVENYTRGILSSLVGVPLISGSRVLGVLGLGHDFAAKRNFDQRTVEIITQFSRMATIAIENARLFQAAQRELSERARAEEALRESQQLLTLIMDNIPQAVFWKDKELRYLGGNSAFLEDADLDSLQDLQGKNDFDMPWKAQAELYRSDDRHILEFGETKLNYEEPQTTQSGQTIWLRTSKVPVRDGNGQIFAVLGMYEDITERKRADEALKESRALFHSLVESMPQNVFSKDLKGRFIFANRHYCMTEGKPLETIIGKTDFELHPHDLAEQYWADDRAVIETEQMIDQVEVHQPLGGGVTYVQVTKAPIYDADGRVKGMLGIFWDVTDRKRAEDALRESEELLRKMNENSPMGMHFYRLEGERLIFNGANPAADKLLEVDNSQFIGKTIEEAFPPLAQTEVPQRYRDAAVNGTPWSTVQVVYNDGKISGAFEVSAFQTAPGNMVSVFADITARKQAEEQIQRLNAELEQRVRERTAQLETTNRELEAFSYSVSHDLRAPLRGIDGWSQALLEDYYGQLDEQGRQYIERVRTETQRMGYLIDDMLKLSRLSRAEMTMQQVDISALVQSIAGQLMQGDPQRQVDFIIQPGITAECDPHLLEAALSNLLDNAFKFTGKSSQARIEFGQSEVEGQRVFFVRDNGAGFDMRYAQKLFGAFQRMHKASEFPGTGVGLAIVQRVIHRHGGRIWVETEVGRGAVFYFTLKEME